ncbi:MAG: PspC domain-containing protein [Rhodospirillales bacterium]|nr:PspC domain-containing protein [Rhodospirillales bacterium]
MMRHEFHETFSRIRRFRPRADAVFLGVCADIATRFGISPWWVRAGVLVCFFSAPILTIAGYLVAAALIARNPAWRFRA